jgi:hypothetical protein
MKRYAFTKSDGIVVQAITGTLNPAQQAQFLRDYATLFGATAIIEVEGGTSVWIGGTYTDGVFAPPPQPEPLPEIVEGESEVLPEPEATEPPDDSIPG